MDRAGMKDANKGYEALMTAVEMINVLRQIPK
jgi:6,7-dimethyl-8-ribityllumazine synthase